MEEKRQDGMKEGGRRKTKIYRKEQRTRRKKEGKNRGRKEEGFESGKKQSKV